MRNGGRRWDPKKVAELVDLKDECEFPVTFEILGNQTDPQGNPIPYERMTQGGKWVRKDAIRYRHWKTYVMMCWVEQVRKRPPSVRNGRYRLNCAVFFKKAGTGSCTHADPENVRKGIQDALFQFGDQHVVGGVECAHTDGQPKVIVRIDQDMLNGCFDRGAWCCPRAGEYNGFGSDGPTIFTCPKQCACHD